MGCDIHLYVEVYKNRAWHSAEVWEPDESDDGAAPDVPYDQSYYDERNYDLFGILADVRNGSGFAGARTGDGFNPISQPRGLPADVSENIRAQSDQWDLDGHSHSWLTVDEMISYDWTQTTTKTGVLDAQSFFHWDRFLRARGEYPSSWSADVNGPNVMFVTENAMRRSVEGRTLSSDFSDLDNHYVRCQWQTAYYKAAGSFLSETMPRLWRLGPPENVRIVFWFDN